MNYGYWVDWGAWQPGDLVYFAGTYRAGISHTGVYIGDGMFIHAENEGTGVVISSIYSDYYSATTTARYASCRHQSIATRKTLSGRALCGPPLPRWRGSADGVGRTDRRQRERRIIHGPPLSPGHDRREQSSHDYPVMPRSRATPSSDISASPVYHLQ